MLVAERMGIPQAGVSPPPAAARKLGVKTVGSCLSAWACCMSCITPACSIALRGSSPLAARAEKNSASASFAVLDLGAPPRAGVLVLVLVLARMGAGAMEDRRGGVPQRLLGGAGDREENRPGMRGVESVEVDGGRAGIDCDALSDDAKRDLATIGAAEPDPDGTGVGEGGACGDGINVSQIVG